MSSSDLEQRVRALEEALSLPSAAKQPAAADTSSSDPALQQRVASLEKALQRSEIRITHLVRGYDEKVAVIKALRADLEVSSKQSK